MEVVTVNSMQKDHPGKHGNKPRKNNRGRRGRRFLPNIDSSQFRQPTTVEFPQNIIGFPDRLVTILKYSEAYTFTGTAVPAAQVWCVNGAFDPNVTGTGHQPSFFDTFTGVYSRYFVRNFKVEVMLSNHTTTAGVWGSLNYSDQNDSANSVEQLIEAKYGKQFSLGISTGSGCNKTVKLPWMSSQKIMGQPFTEADDNMYASFNAIPNDQAFGILKVAADDASTSISVVARVVIYMEIVFKDLLPQVSS